VLKYEPHYWLEIAVWQHEQYIQANIGTFGDFTERYSFLSHFLKLFDGLVHHEVVVHFRRLFPNSGNSRMTGGCLLALVFSGWLVTICFPSIERMLINRASASKYTKMRFGRPHQVRE
jgi:hypothetical protein